ncbi:MAG: hypothetical protein VX899_03155 [Myxococcota bacterium]|nr:hypothetical protein [Myxococcota bacterium]
MLMLLGAVPMLTACYTTGDALRLTIDDPATVVIDSVCSGCATTHTATLAYADGASGPSDAAFVFAQYRVDYALDDGSTVDFYADTLDGSVAEGEYVDFNFTVSGRTQRAYVFETYGSEEVYGTATLTVEGYDWNDEVWSPEPATFDFVFRNIADGEATVDTGL